ncbi:MULTISPECIES: hypothetical protein [Streptomyces]|uniref:Nucleopolyhedrovirus P10 family protein n=2 Tax=Streptomyces rimosus subsp. rimosus TaxID=132474 RepID=L8EIK3_STRR1|nr:MULTISPECIES: hypothetical protein [Streptomyces]KOG77229.1 hypothetical protein ADK78_09045 [Kitasatospora aureofaciens]MYT46848.1 hypothetical protein [Streptomyces sp. SID5471]KEF05716.1 hypothetical protein DF17_17855 [Streptomyces rimosus]KEF17886.1 hypothetical protein DF18_26250 [Streptomyces rimosus]KUJ41010.1 hypothetical protein ADK46_07650 [Streptomyces rimosus subsp. rimosus]
MAGDQLVTAVRQQLGLGRLLPLGGPADGAWVAERPAAGVLREAGDALPGLRVGTVRLSLAAPDAAPEPSVPAPPSALPPGPLRIEADFAATAGRPVPASAGLLREALLTCCAERLGLEVSAVDLRATDLLDEDEGGDDAAGGGGGPEAARTAPGRAGATAESADPLETAVLRVPGVVRLVPALGALSRPVRHEDGHVLVQLAVAADRRALDVARAVRGAVATAAGEERPTVAVLVAALEPPAAS